MGLREVKPARGPLPSKKAYGLLYHARGSAVLILAPQSHNYYINNNSIHPLNPNTYIHPTIPPHPCLHPSIHPYPHPSMPPPIHPPTYPCLHPSILPLTCLSIQVQP